MGRAEDEGQRLTKHNRLIVLDFAESLGSFLRSLTRRRADIVERFARMDNESISVARSLKARTHLTGVEHLLELTDNDIVALDRLTRRTAIFRIAYILCPHG